MFCYGEFERKLEEETGHPIEDFMDYDYFHHTDYEEDCEDESDEEDEEE